MMIDEGINLWSCWGSIRTPLLSLEDISQSTGSYVVDDMIMATATTDDTDGRTTTGVDLYESGLLVSAMAQGPAGTWTCTTPSLTTGAKSYVARRSYASGSVDSEAVTLTVLGSLAPNQVTTATLVEWWRGSESITLATALNSAGTSPPVCTLSGTRTVPLGFFMTCTTGGTVASNAARFSIYIDGGTTPAMTGVAPTSGQVVSITGGGGLSVTFATSGTYNTNNTWTGVCDPFVAKVTATTNDFVQATQSKRPTVFYNATLPGPKYDGTDDVSLVSGTSMPNTVFGGTNGSFYIVIQCRVNTLSATSCIFGATHSTDANLPLCTLQLLTTGYQIQRRVSAGDLSVLVSSVVPTFGYHLFEWSCSSGVSTLRDNGIDVIGGDSGVSGTNTTTGSIAVNQLCIGARMLQSTAGNFTATQYYDIAVFSQPPSAVEQAQLRRYY